MQTKILKILGETYTVETRTEFEDDYLSEADGYCDTSTKKIIIAERNPNGRGNKEDLEDVYQQTLRHEIIHAFLYESGLSFNSWAENEEIVDWIAIQAPKLLDAWQEVSAI